MYGFSVWHFLIILIYLVAVTWPLARVFKRAGWSGWWAALSLLSIVGLAIALWMLAVGRWSPPDGGIEPATVTH